MAKDYAKSTFKTARARAEQRARRRLFLSIFVVSILGIASISGFLFYQTPSSLSVKERMLFLLSEGKSLLHHNKSEEANQIVKTENTVTTENQEPDIHFDFYTELPTMQVTLPATEDQPHKGTPPPAPAAPVIQPKAVVAETHLQPQPDAAPQIKTDTPLPSSPDQAAPASVTPTPTHYIVQIGAYKSDSTASEMRISILLAGFDAKVIKTTIGNKTIYRIQHGPFDSLASAKAALKKLQIKGFDGVVQKIS